MRTRPGTYGVLAAIALWKIRPDRETFALPCRTVEDRPRPQRELMDQGMSCEKAHELALQTHPLMKNYTPEVINKFPEMFNNNWRRAWRMGPR